ncbi:MAG: methyltransferase [Sandaracinaceae bacterium]
MEPEDASFKVFRYFNREEHRWAARSTFRVDNKSLDAFTGDPLVERIVAGIGARRATNIKEVCESFETWARTRRRVRAPHMADLCCGHGLTGLVFAAMERSVETVTLLDHNKPPKADLLVEAVCEAAPWARAKVRWVEDRVENACEHLVDGTAIVAVHACGVRTDRALEAAVAIKGHAAVVPCCYAQTGKKAPRGLRDALGSRLATDVERTYELERHGWSVAWSAIPSAISPMNRILIARAPS